MRDSESDWIARFIRHLETERRLSPYTCKHYRRDLDNLQAFLGTAGVDRWSDVDDEHLRSFSATLYRRGLSPGTIRRRLSATRTFFRYLAREKHTRRNPGANVMAPKGKKRLPENLDADRMARLLDIPGDGPVVARDRAILELLYSSGLRLSELTGLNLADVDLNDQTVHVTGKGNKDRILPVGRMARKALRGWLRERGQLADADETALVRQQSRHAAERSLRAGPGGTLGQTAGHRYPRLPTPVPAFLRQPPAGIEPRPARRAGAAGPCQYQHDPGVYPP